MRDPDLSSLLARYEDVRSQTERLAALFSPEDQTAQSMPDVSPMKWHRGHTTWFFETFVLAAQDATHRPIDPSYAVLFNSYYVGVGPRHERSARGVITRPGSDEVARYRVHVDEAMRTLLEGPLDEGVRQRIVLGLQHEQQHQELMMMDIKHVLAQNPLVNRRDRDVKATVEPGPTGWRSFDAALSPMGCDAGPSFSFDNERPEHRAFVEAFALADRLVTNGEYLAFIDDGGYRRPELWLSDGWSLAQREAWEAPLYWDLGDDGWEEFTLEGRGALDPSLPVAHVGYFEADAFARWSGARLPTEQEWEVVARSLGADDDHRQAALHPGPSDADLFGSLWQWTQSAYSPYPGFAPEAGAIGEYNGKFMINNQVLRGSACVTPVGHSRATYRNFFSPASRWMFSGIRLATATS